MFNRRAATLLSALIIGAAVHLAIVLLLPALAPRDVWIRLEPLAPVGGFHLLPSPQPGDASKALFDPAVVTALCRYELGTASSFRVSGTPSDHYWGLSLHTAQGFVFYAINNRVAGEKELDLRLLTQEQYMARQQDSVDETAQEFLVPTPTRRGYVLLRALVPEPSARAKIEQSIKATGCAAYSEVGG